MEEVDQTFITLILKTVKVENMKQIHLISLSNVLYKIVAKTMENRMKIVLPVVISEEQSAFVKNNALISYEVLHAI